MHLLLTDRGTEPFLIQELRRAFPSGRNDLLAPGLVRSDLVLQPEAPPTLIFARQTLPWVQAAEAQSINGWAQCLFSGLQVIPDHQPWQLHLLALYGAAAAGRNRCRLINDALEELLRRKRRHLLSSLQIQPAPFSPVHSLVQLLLTTPDRGFISIAAAPAPYAFRRIFSPYPKGDIPVASDKAAPSRALAKLLEAEKRMGQRIRSGEVCVDLGASPGSWTYVALNRGARVVAVDRAPLSADLMNHPHLVFHRGNAFSYEPTGAVDWLLCDVIAAPQRSIDLLLRWARERRAARFVVSIKFRGHLEYGLVERLKHALPPLCSEFYLTRLCANKNEVCAFGSVLPQRQCASADRL